jgi:hypothetical protein
LSRQKTIRLVKFLTDSVTTVLLIAGPVPEFVPYFIEALCTTCSHSPSFDLLSLYTLSVSSGTAINRLFYMHYLQIRPSPPRCTHQKKLSRQTNDRSLLKAATFFDKPILLVLPRSPNFCVHFLFTFISRILFFLSAYWLAAFEPCLMKSISLSW